MTLNADGANNDVIIQSNGSTKVTVDGATGNVGIGTSSPAVQNNGAGLVLDIANTGSASTTADNAELVVRSSSRYSALTFITPTDKASTINFGDTADANIGIIQYNHANDSMSFTTNTTTRMNIDSAGVVTMPSQPYALVDFGGGDYVSVSAGVIPFDSISTQTGSNYNTSNYRFTCPVAGLYQVEMGCISSGNTDTYAFIVQKNGTNTTLHYTTARTVHACSTLKCAANDYLTVSLSDGKSLYHGTGTDRYTYATYTLLG